MILEEEGTEIDEAAAKKFAQELSAVFHQFDRLINMLRVYPDHHPLVFGFAEQIHKKMKEIMDREGPIRVRLDATELRTEEGIAFFDPTKNERGEFIWYTPFSDGIVVVEFDPEVDAAELSKFARAIDRASRGAMGIDDDTVTLLWDLNLEHIHYEALEGFVDGGEVPDFDCPEPQAVKMVADAIIEPSGEMAKSLGILFAGNLDMQSVDLFTRLQVEAASNLPTPKLTESDIEYGFALRGDEIDKIVEEWTSGAQLEYRLIEALLSIIRSAPRSKEAKQAGEIIRRVTWQLVEAGELERAASILELLSDRRELVEDARQDPLGELVEELSEPHQIEALLLLLIRRPEEQKGVLSILRQLDESKVLPVLIRGITESAADALMQHNLARLVVELSEEQHDLVSSSSNLQDPIYVEAIVRFVEKRREYHDWPPLGRFLRAALSKRSQLAPVVLGIEHSFWENPACIADYLIPFSESTDPQVRKLAMEKFAALHRNEFADYLRETLVSGELGKRSAVEIRHMIRSYLDIGGGGALEVVTGIAGADHGLFKSAGQRTLSVEAARVLLEFDQTTFRPIIRERTDRFFMHPTLKKSLQELLETEAESTGEADE